jgi:hypothetical protein
LFAAAPNILQLRSLTGVIIRNGWVLSMED